MKRSALADLNCPLCEGTGVDRTLHDEHLECDCIDPSIEVFDCNILSNEGLRELLDGWLPDAGGQDIRPLLLTAVQNRWAGGMIPAALFKNPSSQ